MGRSEDHMKFLCVMMCIADIGLGIIATMFAVLSEMFPAVVLGGAFFVAFLEARMIMEEHYE